MLDPDIAKLRETQLLLMSFFKLLPLPKPQHVSKKYCATMSQRFCNVHLQAHHVAYQRYCTKAVLDIVRHSRELTVHANASYHCLTLKLTACYYACLIVENAC